MTAVIGGPPRFQQSAAFRVEIEGIAVAQFATANIPKQTADVIMQRQGGGRLPVDVATGNISTDKVTLTRGKTTNSDLWDWWQNVKAGQQDQRLVTVIETDTAGNDVTRWPLDTCALVSYAGGEFDNNKSENVVESIELQPIDLDRQAA